MAKGAPVPRESPQAKEHSGWQLEVTLACTEVVRGENTSSGAGNDHVTRFYRPQWNPNFQHKLELM